MKIYKILLLAALALPLSVFSQEQVNDTIVKEKPERPAFESSFLFDNPTNVLFSKNTLEIQMSHRFGELNDDKNDLAGFYGSANIRIGLTYAIHDRLTVGFGTTKNKNYQDFNWKAALLRQTRSDKIPVSVSYYGNFAIDARSKNQGLFIETSDRYSFFNQLIIARRFNPKLSLQVAPSVSHYNTVATTMRNDMVAIALGGRYKISSQTSVIADYSQPLTKMKLDNPYPGISLGFEFGTSAHTFQLFATNYWGILPQDNYMFNKKATGLEGTFGFGKQKKSGQYLIGFNITRNYNF
jgi:Tfp pilus assembly protein PilZ